MELSCMRHGRYSCGGGGGGVPYVGGLFTSKRRCLPGLRRFGETGAGDMSFMGESSERSLRIKLSN